MTSFRRFTTALLAATSLVGCSPTSTSTSIAPPVRADPSLNGVYTIATGPYLEYVTDKTRPVDTYAAAFKSTCTYTGCVATQFAVDRDNKPVPGAPARILDFIDGNWRWSGEIDGTCSTADSNEPLRGRFFKSMSLAPRPDGTLTGTLVTVGGMDPCHVANHAAVTLTKVGDLDTDDSFPDPASLVAPVAAPAAQLHGTYDYHYTDRTADQALPLTRTTASTYCLRTGTKCATLLLFRNGQGLPTNFQVLTYADGRWTTTLVAGEESCAPRRGTDTKTVATVFDLPKPPTAPIATLTGVETTTWAGPCPNERSSDLVLTRTGE